MIETLKKTLLAGVGAAVITKEKVEAALADFVQSGKVNAADARAMARKIASEGRKEFKTVSGDIETRIRRLAASSNANTQARIAELEARIAELEGRKPRTPRTKRSAKTA
jgi:polyhydroxyalkanoate synthesis regulator phasin